MTLSPADPCLLAAAAQMTTLPARAGSDELARQIEFIGSNAIVNGMLASIGCLMAVLNEQRQVLAVNDRFLNLLGSDDPARLLGLWPGEVLGCATTADGSTSCGSGKVCETCGAAIVIATALATDGPVERKCVLTALKGGQSVDLCLQVRGVTIRLDGERFVLVFMQDITEQELATALQRAFFHDIRNSVMGLGSTVELLAQRQVTASPDLLDRVVRLTGRLVREVKIQGALAVDSFGDVEVRPLELTVGQLVEEVHDSFSCHPAGRGKTLRLEAADSGAGLVSDPALVLRVLGNMIVNAFEATPPGGEILLRVVATAGEVVFTVWNREVIPEEVGVRIFQHFYSTKEGAGRGLGTYSMKVFGEKLLGGRVGFTTSAEEGTWFSLALPRVYHSA